jgi:ATP synthase F1 delta subunit
MRISQTPIAKKYATAYLNVYQNALTKNDIDAIFAAFSFFKNNHNFMHLISIVNVEKGEMMKVFETLERYFLLPKSLYQLMALLVKHKRIYYVKDVFQDICALYKLRNNILELEIKTAHSIDAHAVQAFEAFFAQQSHFKVESNVHIDQSLIAGVRLQSDFFIWEYSIASKLKALKHKLVIEG